MFKKKIIKKKTDPKKKFIKKKICKFKPEEIETIDYKDVNRLRYFITERGKIIPSRISGAGAASQRYLTRDPELRYVPSGSAVASFTLAMSRVYKLQTGEKKEETSFVRVVVWGRLAEVCGEYLKKGSPVFCEGRLQSRSWDGADGQKRSTMEVIATNIQFLKSGGTGGAKDMAEAPGGKEELGEIQLDEIPSSGKGDEEVPL